jgi:ATP-dependent HslUV protease subunit HslV
MHGTTVLCIRKKGRVTIIADGQVTQGHCVVKGNARKLRTIGDKVVAGFAGSTADAITLFERLEQKLEANPNQLMRACVELAKDWRTDKYLRKLEAVMIVADSKISLLMSGNGDVLEPPSGVLGIGSGGEYAIAAATALMDFEELSSEEVARRAMNIAGDICIYTNKNFTKLELGEDGKIVKEK